MSRRPAFSLPNADGETVSLDELIDDRWLILSFYRGVW